MAPFQQNYNGKLGHYPCPYSTTFPSSSSRLLEQRRPEGYSINDWANRGQERIYKTLGDGSGAWGDSEDEGGFGAADYDPSLWEDVDDDTVSTTTTTTTSVQKASDTTTTKDVNAGSSGASSSPPQKQDVVVNTMDADLPIVAPTIGTTNTNPTTSAKSEATAPPKPLSKAKTKVKTKMDEAVQDILAQLETVQANRNTTALPKTPVATTTMTPKEDTPPTMTKDEPQPPPPVTNFPSIAQVMVRPQVVNDFIPPTHYHAALGPPPGREADPTRRGPLSSLPPHPAMTSRSTTTSPRSYSSTTKNNASDNNTERPASDSYTSRAPPPPSLGTGSAYGSSAEDKLLILQLELDQLTKQIDTLHDSSGSGGGTKKEAFNINSPKQVSQFLFGVPDKSTSKDTLEGMAASSPMAKLILDYRQVKYQINKLSKRLENKEKGTLVSSVFSKQLLQTTTTTTTTTSTTATTTQPQPQQMADASFSEEDSATQYGESTTITTTTSRVNSDPLLLVDTSAYIFRAYYSMPPMHRSDGMPVGAVLGFCNMLNRLVLNRLLDDDDDIKDADDDEDDGETRTPKKPLPRLVLVMDAPGKTIRHDMYPAYKGNRPEAPMDLIPQFELIRKAAQAYGMVQLQAYSYEADDVIATLCTMALQEQEDHPKKKEIDGEMNENQDDMVIILSSDKDLMQLVTNPEENNSESSSSSRSGTIIQMMDPMTMTRIDHDAVVEKWGVNASQLADVLALAGDAADNIPGVPGIGPKIAASLLSEYGTLDNVYKNLNQIKQQARRAKLQQYEEQARLSRRLVELERHVPVELIVNAADDIPVLVTKTDEFGTTTTTPSKLSLFDGLRMKTTDPQRILAFYQEMGFTTIKRRLEERLEQREQRRQRRKQQRQQRIGQPSQQQWQQQQQRGYDGQDGTIGNGSQSQYSSSSSSSTTSNSRFSKRKLAQIPKPEDYRDVPF